MAERPVFAGGARSLDSLALGKYLLTLQRNLSRGDEMRTLRFSMALALVSLAVALLANHPAAAGEGSSTVKGKVTLEGKPLRSGRIFFHLKNDQFVGAKIKNGEYSVERVPAGKWRITVEGAGVPAIYSSDEKSTLQVEVVANAVPCAYDIKLAK
jgi:hypothetical protein